MKDSEKFSSIPAYDLLPKDPKEITPEILSVLLVLQVVQFPEQVKVSIMKAQKSILIEFEVVDSDKGKVIGKNGHTISAIRSLVSAAAGGSETNYLIHLLEDRGRFPRQPRPRRF